MYTTCVIWLAFVPLYFGTANHVALRITSMSVTISLSASVTLVCLFAPKVSNHIDGLKGGLINQSICPKKQLYIILIRPERNVRQSMMPMRYSAINKSSATTGSGSMMAAVMVTAATCDQKQQIQKHVPPIEADEGTHHKLNSRTHLTPHFIAERLKVETQDSATQTTPPQSPHNEIMNNNCTNVGNGPLALLPGAQLKELTLQQSPITRTSSLKCRRNPVQVQGPVKFTCDLYSALSRREWRRLPEFEVIGTQLHVDTTILPIKRWCLTF